MRRPFPLLIAGGLVALGGGEVILTANGAAQRWNSATLVYYGPQAATVNATAVFLQGSALCGQPTTPAGGGANPTEDVRGKVVVYSRTAATCWVEIVYAEMLRRGAVGVVVVEPWAPPGALAFRHADWDRARSRHAHTQHAGVVSSDAARLFASAVCSLGVLFVPYGGKSVDLAWLFGFLARVVSLLVLFTQVHPLAHDHRDGRRPDGCLERPLPSASGQRVSTRLARADSAAARHSVPGRP